MTKVDLEIAFRVTGTPKPQQSVRAVKTKKGGIAFFSPPTAKDWKRLVYTETVDKLKELNDKQPGFFVNTRLQAVSVSMEFVFERPLKLKKKSNIGQTNILMMHRPDFDNLFKPLFDVMTQVGFWGDDGQIVELFCRKRYADNGELPGVDIKVRYLSGGVA